MLPLSAPADATRGDLKARRGAGEEEEEENDEDAAATESEEDKDDLEGEGG